MNIQDLIAQLMQNNDPLAQLQALRLLGGMEPNGLAPPMAGRAPMGPIGPMGPERGGFMPMPPEMATANPMPQMPPQMGAPTYRPIPRTPVNPNASHKLIARQQAKPTEHLRSPGDVEARIHELNKQVDQEYDAANPGKRDFHAAQRANPMGRPFFNSELGKLPWQQAQHATTTLGGNWGNAFGEIDAMHKAEEGLRPVQVMQAGGGTKTLYRKPSANRTYGGDSTVRNVAGRNRFVSAKPGEGAIPMPEGGYGESQWFKDAIAKSKRPSTVMPLVSGKYRRSSRA